MATISQSQSFPDVRPIKAARMIDVAVLASAITVLWIWWEPIKPLRPVLGLGVVAYALLHWRDVVRAMTLAPWVWIVPGLSALSALWAATPGRAIEHATLMAVVMAVAGVFAVRLSLREILVAMLIGHGILAVLTLFTMTTMWSDGARALIGVFPHKNVAGLRMAMLVIVCLTVLLVKGFSSLVRLCAMAALPAALFIVFASTSAGAKVILAAGMGLALFLFVVWRVVGSVRGGRTITACAAVASAVLAILVLASSSVFDPVGDGLDAIGKDRSLTGRTELWAAAQHVSEQHPVLGVGTGNYWQADNGRAVLLSERLYAASPDAFSFHNLVWEVRVHLGAMGMITVLPILALVAWGMFAAWRRDPSPINAVFLVFLAVFGARALFESGLFRPMTFNFFLFWLFGFAAIVAGQRHGSSVSVRSVAERHGP